MVLTTEGTQGTQGTQGTENAGQTMSVASSVLFVSPSVTASKFIGSTAVVAVVQAPPIANNYQPARERDRQRDGRWQSEVEDTVSQVRRR